MAHFFVFATLLLLLPTGFGAYGDVLEKIPKAFFIFGDSTVDCGNNNYIVTIPEFQADFKPYGENGFFGTPTGRFSDGRIAVDYIAEYAKLPLIPPFMGKSSDFTFGANFASAGAGVLPETHRGLVIDLQTQLKYFETVQKSLVEKLGEAQANAIIADAVYLISMGANDYVSGYILDPEMQERYPSRDYARMVIQNMTQAVQVLYEKGARKWGFLSMFPLGCLPFLRERIPNPRGGCIELGLNLSLEHNNALKQGVTKLGYTLKGFKHGYFNFYDWLDARIKNPSHYGFKNGEDACCGSGLYGGVFSCGGKRRVKEFYVCENPNECVWWDSLHCTDKLEEQLARALWNGSPPTMGPYNLEELFYDKEKVTLVSVVDVPEEQHFQ